MTVAELIKLLQQLPNQDHDVLVNGYEGGLTDVTEANPVIYRRDVNTSWYYGRHEQVYDYELEKLDETTPLHNGYVLSR